MEDFIEIIFYVVVLVLSGIGSIMKNKMKNQAQRPQQPASASPETDEAHNVERRHSEPSEPQCETSTAENELIRMLREAAEVAAAQQREAELLEEQEKRAQEEEKERQREQERQRREAEMRAQREAMERAEKAKLQAKQRKSENDKANQAEQPLFDVDFSDVDAARRAFIASEIFNKKYC